MTLLKRIATLILALILISCGGGGGSAGTSPFGDGTTSTTSGVSNLTLVLSANSLPNTGSGTVTATATATAATGQVVPSVPVTFSTDNNATFSVSGASTDTTGTTVATINVGADRSNRVVTVHATSGGLTATAAFAVTGAALSGTPIPAIVAPGSTGNRVDSVLSMPTPRRSLVRQSRSLPVHWLL